MSLLYKQPIVFTDRCHIAQIIRSELILSRLDKLQSFTICCLQLLEYSDDEEEAKAKSAARKRRQNER